MDRDLAVQPFRLGIWAAVSSKPQAGDDKISLESQEAEGRALAEKHGANFAQS